MPGIYNFCWYFLIFSFVGWTIESALVSCQQKKPVNRGFLAGPICPIYGTAMCLIILTLTPIKLALLPAGFGRGNANLLDFAVMLLASTLIACAVEYFVGLMLEKMFNQRWWDYSDHRINLNGRIAVPESLAWGPLATLAVIYAVPWLDSLIVRIPQGIGYAVLAGVAVITAADVIRILGKMKTFDRIAVSLRAGAEEFHALMEKIREHEDEKQRRRTARRIRRERKLRARLTAAYPRLAEKWRILREEEKRQDEDKNK